MNIKYFLDRCGGYKLLEGMNYQEFFNELTGLEDESSNWKAFSRTFLEDFNLNEVLSKMNELNRGFGKIVQYSATSALEIPDSIETIDSETFSGCTDLELIRLSKNLKHIKSLVFAHCFLKSLEIPESVEYIGEKAFWDCANLKSIKLPGKLKVLSSGIFRESGLELVEIPNSVEEIGDDAFRNCIGLKLVKLSEGLKKIGWRAFRDCISLESIEIPNSVEKIEGFAFDRCPRLKTIKISPNHPYFMLNKYGQLVYKDSPISVII